MSINFNIGKSNKTLVVADEEEKEIDDDDDEDEEVEVKHSSGLSNTLIKIALIIICFLILLFVVLYLSSLTKKKVYTYEQIEVVLKNAAISYFNDYPGKLPKNEKEVMKIEDTTLVAAGKMRDLSYYSEKGVACSGHVEVRKSSNDYVYTPYLNCGDKYASMKLVDAVIKKTVTSGYGVYKMDNEYVVRGEKVNNFVKLDNSMWQVVKVTSNRNVVLIRYGELPLSHAWDNRFNVEENYKIGINNFNSSRIKEALSELYNDEILVDKLPILSSNDKSKLVSFDLCIGKRKIDAVGNYNSIECSDTVQNVKIGLPTLSDYIRASIDSNCKSADSKACQNYNYLSAKMSYWLVTANAADTYHVYSISSVGTISNSYATDYAFIRPVIHLNSNVMISGGTGTLTDPYIVK